MLTETQLQLIKATVPVLKEHGATITAHFYKRMFARHPELQNVFNLTHQKTGAQSRSLAASVLAYAEYLDQPGFLSGMVGRIAHKHASLEVLPEHYPIVGENLLAAIQEVLGEAATPEIIDAWGAAYGILADIMIGAEKSLYQAAPWEGFKAFTVVKKVQESAQIASLHLKPADGAPLAPFKPGQYVSIRIKTDSMPYTQIRQYSLSDAPGGDTLRISVKRELAPETDPTLEAGVLSNILHDHIQEGDTLDVHAPMGEFVLQERGRPVVLLAGGVGITPLLSMAKAAKESEVHLLQFVMKREDHAFREELQNLQQQNQKVKVTTFYTHLGANDVLGVDCQEMGLITTEKLLRYVPLDADFYYCGPVGFMQAIEGILDDLQVPANRRFFEAFGPTQDFKVGPERELHP
ncbi:NO-inducible flavohemoprotein [Deinococcus cellulosilyticus]|uniref:Flavohemoprotein n=1 Tax=Deinococcus cellulosilyticus (strain DSM 18568 / NBRC 106333 / KACC 11606 / 5516J-15) TaxID=1223518 RepID=A0A511MXP3_DEIC1|nr:NO-inducible flavohemoprotein [Deinococcus cellulosilyticus]GEM45048.1 flavohemoprotein [Deinococcus cellulosilyticus NBRC 106333 = KACC 11606]